MLRAAGEAGASCPAPRRRCSYVQKRWEIQPMKRIKTIATRDLEKSAKTGGCGECQTSCQSACKTSCGVANQKCENSSK